MSELKILTNNRPRKLLSGFELTPKERKEFDYIVDLDNQIARFFRYRNWIYDTQNFMAAQSKFDDSPLKDWQGYSGDTFFSGVVIKYVNDDCEEIIAGRYYS